MLNPPEVSPECVNRIPVVQSDGTTNIDLTDSLNGFEAAGIEANPGDGTGNLDSCKLRVEREDADGTPVTIDFEEENNSDAFFARGEMDQTKLEELNPDGGIYHYQTDSGRTTIWVKLDADAFFSSSITSRLNISSMPTSNFMFDQRLFFLRRNNTMFNPVCLIFSCSTGNSFNASSLTPLYTFNSSEVITQPSVTPSSQCYRITIKNSLLQSGEFLYLNWAMDAHDEEEDGVRDDVAIDPFTPAPPQGSQCIEITVPEDQTPATPAATTMVTMPGTGSTVDSSDTPTDGALTTKAGVAIALAVLVAILSS